MSKIFLRKQFSYYLGENRAINDTIVQFIPDGPPPSPTPTPSITPTITPSITPTITPSITPSVTPTKTTTPTPTLTPTITPSTSPPPPFDADAAAYLAAVISAGGTTNPTISAATNTLFTSLKSAGIYSQLTAFYPTVGGTAASHAVEGKTPGGAYNLTFYGTWAHTPNGMKPLASSPYATTNLIPSIVYGGTNIMSMGVYTTESNTAGDTYHLGTYEDNNHMTALGGRSGSVAYFNANNTTFTIVNADSSGFLTLTSNGSTAIMNLYRSSLNTSFTNTPTGISPSNNQFYIGALNFINSYYSSSLVNTNFVYFSNYLTPTQIVNFQNIVQLFNTALTRQV